VAELRSAIPLLQRVFRFRTCKLDIRQDDPARASFRPCILHPIKQCSGPCAARISRGDYRKDIANLLRFLESKGSAVARQIRARMQRAAESQDYERAAALRDQLKALEGLQKRGLVDQHEQPEVFFVDPEEGLTRLGELLGADIRQRTIEGIDIAHLGGGETAGSLVCFIDGKPFKQGYRRYRIRTAQAGDDYAAIREVVCRRYKHAALDEEIFPDIILIDGGTGQLNAASWAFDDLPHKPPTMISLAKKEELIHILGRGKPLALPRNDPALRLLQSVRDEAHRFAQSYHHILRRRKMLEQDQPVRHHKRAK
jgi:excinuclease ABC subunit C